MREKEGVTLVHTGLCSCGGRGERGRPSVAQLLNKTAGHITVRDQAQCSSGLKPSLLYSTWRGRRRAQEEHNSGFTHRFTHGHEHVHAKPT